MMIRIISILCYVLLAPFLGGLLAGIDRKLSARMQGRRGPSIFQPFYDVIKLLSKEYVIVSRAQTFLVLSFLIFMIFSGALLFGGYDMLLSFFALTTAMMFLVLAASVTHSPYSTMGAQRELLQMMAYEPMVLLTAVGFYMATGTFAVSKIVDADLPAIIRLPGFFLGFVFIMSIKLRKSPFDLSTSHHAHQEMVKGITTEMSGKLLAVYEIAEWYEYVYLLGVLALFIINKSIWSIPVAVVVCLICFFSETLLDNISARLKWEKVLGIAWFVTLVTGCLNMLILQLIHF